MSVSLNEATAAPSSVYKRFIKSVNRINKHLENIKAGFYFIFKVTWVMLTFTTYTMIADRTEGSKVGEEVGCPLGSFDGREYGCEVGSLVG